MTEKHTAQPRSPETETVGFIGLGLMGRPMAYNLFQASLWSTLIVHSRSPGPVQDLAATCDGMTTAATPAAIAEVCDIIILMLSDTPAVQDVLCCEQGILSALRPGTLIIDMGTTDPLVTRHLAKTVQDKGASYVDAPVSGGTVGAISGELVIMAGGPTQALQRAAPILDVLGKKTTHVGEAGAGQVAKAANQIIVGLTIGAVAEALALARRAGVDPARVRQALKGGFADSTILELHGKRMVDHEFAPGAKCTTQRKDLDQALTLATALELTLPATALCRDLYDTVIEAGHGELDHAALIKAIELN